MHFWELVFVFEGLIALFARQIVVWVWSSRVIVSISVNVQYVCVCVFVWLRVIYESNFSGAPIVIYILLMTDCLNLEQCWIFVESDGILAESNVKKRDNGSTLSKPMAYLHVQSKVWFNWNFSTLWCDKNKKK